MEYSNGRTFFDIYGLLDPRNNELFYIGQTVMRTKYRLINHYASAKRHGTPVYKRINHILNSGSKPIIVTLKQVDSYFHNFNTTHSGRYVEKIFIEEYSKLGTLLNILHNPLYNKLTKSFDYPNAKKELKFKDGRYYVESDEIKYLHYEKYNPFNNHRFKLKILTP